MYQLRSRWLRIAFLSILISNLVMLVSCTKKDNEIKDPNELPIENSILDKYSDYEIISKAMQKNYERDNHLITTEGVTDAKFGFISYTQKTTTSLYFMQDKFYNDISSTSSIVNHYHRLILTSNDVKYYDSDNDNITTTTLDEYKNIYGKVPSHTTFFNYNIDESTIISSKRNFTNKRFEITYNLEPEKAMGDIAKQMMMFGGLSEEPKFKSITLTIRVDEDLNILSFKNVEVYTIVKDIPVVGTSKLNCVQTLNSKVYYNDYSEPDLNEFE